MQRRILIAGAGANQLGIIAKARAMGLYTVAADGDPEAAGLAAADAGVAANIADADAVTAVAREHGVHGVYPAAEWAVEACAHAATRLGLPGIGPEVARPLRNKLALREALAEKGVPGPPFAGAVSVEEARAALERVGLPAIVKPADGNASKGVTRVDRPEELDAAFARAHERSRVGTVLIEGYLDGEEYNVDGLVHEGRYIRGGQTAKERSAPPNRFDLGIHMPPREPDDVLDAVVGCVTAALDAIGFTTGTTHAEVIVTPDGPRIVEVAGRPGGGRIPTDLIPLTYGMDFMADSLRIALGEAPRERRTCARGTAVYWIPADAGEVARIDGVAAAQAVPGVREVVLAARPGDRLDALIDCVTRDRIGYVLADGETVEEAIASAKRGRDHVRVVTTPPQSRVTP